MKGSSARGGTDPCIQTRAPARDPFELANANPLADELRDAAWRRWHDLQPWANTDPLEDNGQDADERRWRNRVDPYGYREALLGASWSQAQRHHIALDLLRDGEHPPMSLRAALRAAWWDAAIAAATYSDTDSVVTPLAPHVPAEVMEALVEPERVEVEPFFTSACRYGSRPLAGE